MNPKKPVQDIFSSKEILRKPLNKNSIIIDTREKQSLVASELINKNVCVKFEHLEIADYLIGDIAIERKTLSDFINSMINKRIQMQLKELKKYPKQFLIIEGFDFDYRDFTNKNALRGFVLSIILDFQVPIIYTKNEQETAEFLILLTKKQEKSKQEISLRPSKTLKTIEEQKQFILEGFPGIGPTIAKKLLEKFQTLENTFNASEQELNSIEKLDKKKIKRLKEILRG